MIRSADPDAERTSAVGADPRHGWVWAVLPADSSAVFVGAEEGVAGLLEPTGMRVLAPDADAESEPVDAVVLSRPEVTAGALDALVGRLRTGGVLAVPLDPEGLHSRPRPRSRRGPARLAGMGRAAAAARDVEATFRARGLETWRVPLGARSGAHRLGVGGHGPRLPAAVVVAGSRGEPRPSLLAECLAAAGSDLGGALELRGATVRGSGALLASVSRDGERYLLRLTVGAADELHDVAIAAVRRLEREAPAAVSRLLLPPVAEGEAGPARYSLERHAPGRTPRWLGRSLWDQCMRFVIELRRAREAPGRHGEAVAADVRVLSRHLSGAERVTLGRHAAALTDRLVALPGGWTHGDLWPGNLLARRGRLTAVIDWDAATAAGLPLVDLLHLIALGDRGLRRLPHGRRCTEGLWPLARRGGDRRMRAYCEATGTPGDPATLEALAGAYWLSRVARDLRTFPDRPSRGDWMEANLHAPLAALARG